MLLLLWCFLLLLLLLLWLLLLLQRLLLLVLVVVVVVINSLLPSSLSLFVLLYALSVCIGAYRDGRESVPDVPDVSPVDTLVVVAMWWWC